MSTNGNATESTLAEAPNTAAEPANSGPEAVNAEPNAAAAEPQEPAPESPTAPDSGKPHLGPDSDPAELFEALGSARHEAARMRKRVHEAEAARDEAQLASSVAAEDVADRETALVDLALAFRYPDAKPDALRRLGLTNESVLNEGRVNMPALDKRVQALAKSIGVRLNAVQFSGYRVIDPAQAAQSGGGKGETPGQILGTLFPHRQ